MERSLGAVIGTPRERDGARLIYLDLGSRNLLNDPHMLEKIKEKAGQSTDLGSFTASSVGTFASTYPDGRAFRVVAFEADPVWAAAYAPPLLARAQQRFNYTHPIRFINRAVGTRDRRFTIAKDRAHTPSASFADADASPASPTAGAATAIHEIDFLRWLRAEVTAQDFVVVKMDIEKSEFDVVPALIAAGIAPLIDELFMECHHIETFGNGPHTYAECLAMYKQLLAAGVWVHEWY
jgi:FkbM family methyltransferase